jgi:hypothetical protein
MNLRAVLLALLLPGAVLAQAPGEYVTQWGVLRVSPAKGGALPFKLNTVGANRHICELEGAIRNGQARLEESSDDKKPCIVTFKLVKDNGIEVASLQDSACQVYCGARATFQDTYYLPPPSCAPSHVAGVRKRFKAAYDAKAYADALALLSPVHQKCEKFMQSNDFDWVSNDLAITQYRAGDVAACRKTLASLVELAQTPDKDIREGYPPSDAEAFLRLARAARANLKLCGQPVETKSK